MLHAKCFVPAALASGRRNEYNTTMRNCEHFPPKKQKSIRRSEQSTALLSSERRIQRAGINVLFRE